ncbi:hypothetical protein GCM10022408_15850 [Hymenobacter fastidiosus]|uniref:NADPH-dependent FMN reductase-like domain-containing protein n=1 Tax=Hymenobacter fastidiosus TaxID=486264 RepID=A0ABP7S0H3_9BACT
MITIIASTNRPNSRARLIADIYAELLTDLGAPHQILDLADLPADFISTALYHNAGKHETFNRLAQQAEAADKLVFIVPEYNNSMPGVLKAFIDGLPYPGGVRGKKAALVGLSSGDQGGLAALSHLTDILMYLGTTVMPSRVRLPAINQHLGSNGELTNSLYQQLLKEQATQLLAA